MSPARRQVPLKLPVLSIPVFAEAVYSEAVYSWTNFSQRFFIKFLPELKLETEASHRLDGAGEGRAQVRGIKRTGTRSGQTEADFCLRFGLRANRIFGSLGKTKKLPPRPQSSLRLVH